MGTALKSGRIWMADGEIHYESQDYGSWSFPAADLRIFGELTTDHGPMIDDWFFVFVVSSGPGWFEGSVYAEGADDFRRQLATALGADDLHGELFASTEFASRIIWPEPLRGQPLFRFTPIPSPWWQRILRFGIETLRVELSPAVKLCAGHTSSHCVGASDSKPAGKPVSE